MHEAGIAERILEVVAQRAVDANAARVTDVYLQVGEACGIDPEAVALHWPFVARRSVADGARLHFEPVADLSTFRLAGIEVEDGRRPGPEAPSA